MARQEEVPLDKPFTLDNRRTSERIPVVWRARVLLPQGSVIETRTFDISATGVGVLSDNPLPLKTVLQVALQVPARSEPGRFQVVTGPAMPVFQVLRNHEYRVGMQWMELPPQTQKALAAWTGARLPTPAAPTSEFIDI